MTPQGISRRLFLAGSGAFGAFGAFSGCRFLVGDVKKGSTPNLTLGVLSDVHIEYAISSHDLAQSCARFRQALEWFRDQGVDAVMVVGDIADNGIVEQLQAAAETWQTVFPNNRAPDGRVVERLFLTGNHEWEGRNSKDKYRPTFLSRDYARNWERIMHEPYSPIFLKTVKGYTFIGQHWDHQDWFDKCRFERIEPFMAAHGKEIDPKLPFFYFQHPHLRNTVYGSWINRSCDTGIPTRVLSAFPNAIALSGHSHRSLTDERSIWQGAFTAVATASLKSTAGMPLDVPGRGYENAGVPDATNWRLDAEKLMPSTLNRHAHQGMLWRVYDECIVIQRRDFESGLDLGTNWVLPLPAAESKPFAFAEHAKRLAAPEFPSNAALKTAFVRAKTRGGKSRDKSESVPVTEQKALEIRFPSAAPHVMRYRVEVKGDHETCTRYILSHAYNQPPTSPKARVPHVCTLACNTLPQGRLNVRVWPENCFGKAGNFLECGVSVNP